MPTKAKDTAVDKAATTTTADDGTTLNVVAGPAEVTQTVVEQAKEARDEADPAKDDGGKVDGAVTAAAKAATTPEMELKDAAKKARLEVLKGLGIGRNQHGSSGDETRVGESVGKEKLYSGNVTVTGVSGEYDNSKISTRINIGSQPRGLGWLKYAFKQHFPSADTEASFEVDEKNETDPLLRTKFD